MSGEHSQQLAQLVDIHAAAAPGWWPPAPGWWLLAIVLLLILYRLLRAGMQKLALRRRRQAWLQELQFLSSEHDPSSKPHEYLAALNRLFRAVALRAFPDTACVKLQGKAWVAFLSGLLPEGEAVENLAALASGPYQPAPRFDAEALHALAAEWVKLYG